MMDRAAGCLFGWIPRALIGALENRPQPVEPPVVEGEQPRGMTAKQHGDRAALIIAVSLLGLAFLAGLALGLTIKAPFAALGWWWL